MKLLPPGVAVMASDDVEGAFGNKLNLAFLIASTLSVAALVKSPIFLSMSAVFFVLSSDAGKRSTAAFSANRSSQVSAFFRLDSFPDAAGGAIVTEGAGATKGPDSLRKKEI
jgi:hypothetical protein